MVEEQREEKKSVLMPTDAAAIRHARTILRTARHGALATLDPASGRPNVTRVGVSTDIDGAPLLLISKLAAHTPALLADPRCSLLLGEPGKGDPLAHPRITLACTARPIERNGAEHSRLEQRYLAHQPKAKLYAGLGDFSYFRLEPESASFNAGFGRAYALAARDVLTLSPANAELAESETSAIAHMNADHSEAVSLYAQHFAKAPPGRWELVGIDADGIDLAAADEVRRVFFDAPLASAAELRAVLARMAAEARGALSPTGQGA